jgi:hypothetical protein
VRTSPDLVRAAIKYAPTIDTNGFIRTANRLVNYIVSQDTDNLLVNSGLDIELETYLACFYCALKYPQYNSKSTGDASGNFQTGQPDRGFFNQNDWGRQAIGIDVTGVLAQLNDPDKGSKVLQMAWLGTPTNSQLSWWERNPWATGC